MVFCDCQFLILFHYPLKLLPPLAFTELTNSYLLLFANRIHVDVIFTYKFP